MIKRTTTHFAGYDCVKLENDGILFAGTEACGFFHSEDRGPSWTHLGEDAITNAVNGIILSPEFPAKPDLMLLLSDALLVSRDGGKSRSDWKVGLAGP
jgi:hypothetical protein